jgi:hypothetical protein
MQEDAMIKVDVTNTHGGNILGFRVAGAMLALGGFVLFVGTLFYITMLTVPLNMPTYPSSYPQALIDAHAVGPRPMSWAGNWTFFGDLFIMAGSLALMSRRRTRSDLESAGWALIAVSVLLALIFDSVMAVLLAPLSRVDGGSGFLAFKAWFDFLFAAGNVPWGLGGVAVLWANAHSPANVVPKWLYYPGMVIFSLGALSGAGYVTGWLLMPNLIGFTASAGALAYAGMGTAIALSSRNPSHTETDLPVTLAGRAA